MSDRDLWHAVDEQAMDYSTDEPCELCGAEECAMSCSACGLPVCADCYATHDAQHNADAGERA